MVLVGISKRKESAVMCRDDVVTRRVMCKDDEDDVISHRVFTFEGATEAGSKDHRLTVLCINYFVRLQMISHPYLYWV